MVVRRSGNDVKTSVEYSEPVLMKCPSWINFPQEREQLDSLSCCSQRSYMKWPDLKWQGWSPECAGILHTHCFLITIPIPLAAEIWALVSLQESQALAWRSCFSQEFAPLLKASYYRGITWCWGKAHPNAWIWNKWEGPSQPQRSPLSRQSSVLIITSPSA